MTTNSLPSSTTITTSSRTGKQLSSSSFISTATTSNSVSTNLTTSLSATTTVPAINAPTNTSQNQNPNNIATSASLYLYTFLATLVLLLSVSAAIVIRSFVLRRRHRRMVEEAIRNGTWVPPAPPTRPVKVDLSKKPMLWEAYIDKKGDLVGHTKGDGSAGMTIGSDSSGKLINEAWRGEQAREWDLIKPFAAAYLAPSVKTSSTAAPGTAISPTTANVVTPGLATVPSVGSLRAAASAETETPATPVMPTGPGPDLEAGVNNAATSVPPPTTIPVPPPVSRPSSTHLRVPRHRAILSRVARVLSPTPAATSPLPATASRSNAGSNTNLPGTNDDDGNHHEMSEMSSTEPKMVRVAVLIAMPSPPSTSSSSSQAGPSQSPSPSPSPPDPLSRSDTIAPVSTSYYDDDEEDPLPHIEVGVADVLLNVTPSSSIPPPITDHDYSVGNGKEKLLTAGQRGSVGSMGSEVTEEV